MADKDTPIYDKTRMRGTTWVDATRILFNMGSELEEQVDGISIDQMEDTSARVDALEDDMQTAQQAIVEIQQKDTEQDTAIQNNEDGLVTGTELSYANGQLTLKLTRKSGELSDVVDVPFFKTVTLIPTSTERAFKLQFTMWDDSVYDTNEFVIPAGGGTDVSVTGVTVEDGNNDNSFKVSIQLSDGTPIDSNDYPFPIQTESPYPTSLTGVVGADGNITFTVTMSSGSPLTTTINMNYFATVDELADYLTIVKAEADYAKKTDVSAIGITTSGNTATVNGKSANIVNSISGRVDENNNLILNVNGVESGGIPLPESGAVTINPFGPTTLTGLNVSQYAGSINNYGFNLRYNTNYRYYTLSYPDNYMVDNVKFVGPALLNFSSFYYISVPPNTIKNILTTIFGNNMSNGSYRCLLVVVKESGDVGSTAGEYTVQFYVENGEYSISTIENVNIYVGSSPISANTQNFYISPIEIFKID